MRNKIKSIPLASNEAKGYYIEGVGGYNYFVIGALGVIIGKLDMIFLGHY